jgi:hypothetical protein
MKLQELINLTETTGKLMEPVSMDEMKKCIKKEWNKLKKNYEHVLYRPAYTSYSQRVNFIETTYGEQVESYYLSGKSPEELNKSINNALNELIVKLGQDIRAERVGEVSTYEYSKESLVTLTMNNRQMEKRVFTVNCKYDEELKKCILENFKNDKLFKLNNIETNSYGENILRYNVMKVWE